VGNPGLAVNGVLGDGLVDYLAIGHVFIDRHLVQPRLCGRQDMALDTRHCGWHFKLSPHKGEVEIPLHNFMIYNK
jgi:hypothetical protein